MISILTPRSDDAIPCLSHQSGLILPPIETALSTPYLSPLRPPHGTSPQPSLAGPLWKYTVCWFTAHEGPTNSQSAPRPPRPVCASPMLPDRHLGGGALPFWGCPHYYDQNCQGRRLYHAS
jgi:hypothetical protein